MTTCQPATSVLLMALLLPFNTGAQQPLPDECLPTEIDGMQAVEFPPGHRDAIHKHRNTQISGYNAEKFNTTVTAYIYDKEPKMELLQEFRDSGSAVIAAHSGTETPMSGPSKITIAGNPTDGYLGIFLWSEGKVDFGSFLWVGEVAGKYVKIRTTWIRPEQDDQTATAMRFSMQAMRNVANHICIPASVARSP